VKLAAVDGELFVLAESADRINKERSMRQRRLKKLWKRLRELSKKKISEKELLMRLGAAKHEAGRAWNLVDVTSEPFSFQLNKEKLRQVRRREGRYLLRSNLAEKSPEALWRMYMQLSEIEQVFKELKQDLNLRPIHHQKDDRIEAHIFVSFLAYCLTVTLKHRLRSSAPGLTPRSALDQMKGILMIDVQIPTTDGRQLSMSRFTQPDKAQQILLAQLGMALPPQPPPKITTTMGKEAEYVVKT
jgi:transposase